MSCRDEFLAAAFDYSSNHEGAKIANVVLGGAWTCFPQNCDKIENALFCRIYNNSNPRFLQWNDGTIVQQPTFSSNNTVFSLDWVIHLRHRIVFHVQTLDTNLKNKGNRTWRRRYRPVIRDIYTWKGGDRRLMSHFQNRKKWSTGFIDRWVEPALSKTDAYTICLVLNCDNNTYFYQCRGK